MRISHCYRVESDCLVQMRHRFRTQLGIEVSLAKKIICLRGGRLKLQCAIENFDCTIQVLHDDSQPAQVDHCGNEIRFELQCFKIARLGFEECFGDEEVSSQFLPDRKISIVGIDDLSHQG